jgi:hypothetical protein
MTNPGSNPPALPQQPPKPSPWELIHDDTKTLITIATALLGLTITFSDKILGVNASRLEISLLILTWVVLCAVVITSILGSAGVSTYLHGITPNANSGILSINISFFLLVLSIILFIVFGGIQVLHKTQQVTATIGIDTATKFLTSLHPSTQNQWDTESLTWDKPNQTYRIILVNVSDNFHFSVVIDGNTGDVIEYSKTP